MSTISGLAAAAALPLGAPADATLPSLETYDVVGGVSSNSPTCNGSTVSGCRRDDAARIWHRASAVYVTSGTDYHGARTASLDAARDLFTAGSVQYNAVATAWSAVGVS